MDAETCAGAKIYPFRAGIHAPDEATVQRKRQNHPQLERMKERSRSDLDTVFAFAVSDSRRVPHPTGSCHHNFGDETPLTVSRCKFLGINPTCLLPNSRCFPNLSRRLSHVTG